MNISNISPWADHPNVVNVIIEIPMDSGSIKYEFDKELGLIKIDRFMPTSMYYPCNYGFIPNTLSGDGDPVDVLVYSTQSIFPGCLISVKPIGVLITEDEKGSDEKILAVPSDKVDVFFKDINSYKQLPETIIDKISHFFENYKKLEKAKWVKVQDWQDAGRAKEIISQSIENFKKIPIER
jgi:inorganic pyrophosphatase